MTDFSGFLSIARSGRPLAGAEMRAAMDALLEGNVAADSIAEFLLAIRNRGETVEELIAAAEAMRARAIRVEAPEGAVDTCGTGGDGADTFNISTAAALVVAGCGVPVAKHGNRAASSKSGSSDVLAALGVNISASPSTIARCIRDANVGFMFAAYHHRAVAHVADVRKRLGVRTIFNLLGPLSNPAGAKRQLMGIYDRTLTGPLAAALGALGAERVWVVAGKDGLDELTTTTSSYVSEYHDGAVRNFEIFPEDVGIERSSLESLKGGKPAENAATIRELLHGRPGPFRDITVLNAAAALVISSRAKSLRHGAELAALSIDSGRASEALEKLIAISHEPDR